MSEPYELATARQQRDDAQAAFEYEAAKQRGRDDAYQTEGEIKQLMIDATALSKRIAILQSKDRVWDCLLDGIDVYDLETDDVQRSWEFGWLEKYAEKYADLAR